MRARAYKGLLAAIVAASAMSLPVGSAASASTEPDPAALSKSVKAPSVKRHLEKLQQIADANGGTRASGTPGHEASVAYVAGRLRAAGYNVTLQEFEFPFFRVIGKPVLNRVTPDAKAYASGTDFRPMTYSGSGNVTADVQAVDLVLPPTPAPSSTSGCEAADFAGFVPGNIALLQRGTCNFQVKAELAQAAGASGVIIFNEGQPGEGANDRRGLLTGTLGEPTTHIPVVGAAFAVGNELAASGTRVTLTVNAESDLHRKTRNVLAESRWGDPNKVVMLGGHLDSVAEGPGINDNGSGSAGVLETALKANLLPTRNRLRFAFWGAEELGLLGSQHYVASLSPEEKAKIKLYLNFDMIASPNFIYGIYDGDDSDHTGSPAGPPGSDKIEKLFEAYFTAVGQPYKGTDFTGRSDYGPFIAAGIPAGGLFTGAEGLKTPEEAATFGGEAGVAYDKCYHRACDTIANINDRALAVNTGAIATAAFVYAYSPVLPGGTATAAPVSNQRRSGDLQAQDEDHAGVAR
ncbi:M28 family metallopeptidase [Streptosporangium sp. NPDC051023]|uniref:M28 family metallopeptidase n=1 Tax=Streptosporangium sp. NPDC051023 TaxID=3155410 RepID=UPI00344EEE81